MPTSKKTMIPENDMDTSKRLKFDQSVSIKHKTSSIKFQKQERLKS